MLGEEGYTETLYPIYSFPISLKLFQNKGFFFFFFKYIGSYCSSAEKPPVALNVRCIPPYYHGLQIPTGSDPAHLSSHFRSHTPRDLRAFALSTSSIWDVPALIVSSGPLSQSSAYGSAQRHLAWPPSPKQIPVPLS